MSIWRIITNEISTAFFGAVFGFALNALITRYFSDGGSGLYDNRGLLIGFFLVLSICSIVLSRLFKHSEKAVKAKVSNLDEGLNEKIDDVFLSMDGKFSCLEKTVCELISSRAVLLDKNSAYSMMSYSVATARNIKLLTRTRYDKQNNSDLSSGERKKYYESLLNAACNDNVVFNHTIQIDEKLSEWPVAVSNSAMLTKEFLTFFSRDRKIAKSASTIQLINTKLEMSFLLIDSNKLFFNIFSEKEYNQFATEVMFYIESNDNGLHELGSKFDRLGVGATQVTEDDIKLLSQLSNELSNAC